MRSWLPLSVSLLGAWLSAQDPAATAVASEPLRVHVIGASVSGGFRDGPQFGGKEQGDTVTLQQLLKKWCGDHARASTHNTVEMMAMFMRPDDIGKTQIEGVAKAKADFVTAIDFPFWFAYGHIAGEDEGKVRAQHFARGLDLLGKLEMPVLVGDLPDMTGAAQRMLSPSQIPSADVLKALNGQLAEFVKAHANFHLVPLAALVHTMKVDGAKLPLADGVLATPPGALLQGDRLHATRLGMALLGWSIQDDLRAVFPKDHPLHEQKWTFEQFVEAAGADEELEAQRAAAKTVKKAG